MEFLLDLGRAGGADQTLSEPDGELGLVTQRDPQWSDQIGSPRDPQPGNGSTKFSPGSQALAAVVAAAVQQSYDSSLLDGQSSDSGVVILGIVDLEGSTLEETIGSTALIDTTAAGYEWFVDLTPAADSESGKQVDSTKLQATPASAASGRTNLPSAFNNGPVSQAFGSLLFTLGFKEETGAPAPASLLSDLSQKARGTLKLDPSIDLSGEFTDASDRLPGSPDWIRSFLLELASEENPNQAIRIELPANQNTSEEAPTEAAIAEMGNPGIASTQLPKTGSGSSQRR